MHKLCNSIPIQGKYLPYRVKGYTLIQISATEKKGAGARAGHRYLLIRHLALLRGMRIKDLHIKFTHDCIAQGLPPCHYSVFYRVCQGKRVSTRIMRWLSKNLKERHSVLWA
jgi:hypothetical protein